MGCILRTRKGERRKERRKNLELDVVPLSSEWRLFGESCRNEQLIIPIKQILLPSPKRIRSSDTQGTVSTSGMQFWVSK